MKAHAGLVQVCLSGAHEQAGVDPGPQDHQHNAFPLGSQELERIPDVLRRFRPTAAW